MEKLVKDTVNSWRRLSTSRLICCIFPAASSVFRFLYKVWKPIPAVHHAMQPPFLHAMA